MNKIIVVGIIVVIGLAIIGISLSDTSKDIIANDVLDENINSSEPKHYSETLREFVNVNTP